MLGVKLHPWRVFSLCAPDSCLRTRFNDTLHRWPVFRKRVPLLHQWPVFSLSMPGPRPWPRYGYHHAWHRRPIPTHPWRVYSLGARQLCPRTPLNDMLHRRPVPKQSVPLLHR